MLGMEFIAEIRRRHFVDGESISSIAHAQAGPVPGSTGALAGGRVALAEAATANRPAVMGGIAG